MAWRRLQGLEPSCRLQEPKVLSGSSSLVTVRTFPTGEAERNPLLPADGKSRSRFNSDRKFVVSPASPKVSLPAAGGMAAQFGSLIVQAPGLPVLTVQVVAA